MAKLDAKYTKKIERMVEKEEPDLIDEIIMIAEKEANRNNHDVAVELYNIAVDKNDSAREGAYYISNFIAIVRSIYDHLDNKRLANSILGLAFDESVNLNDYEGYRSCAESMIDIFNDSGKARKFYEKVIEIMLNQSEIEDRDTVSDGLLRCAQSICENLDDKKWGLEIIDQAIPFAETPRTLFSIADTVNNEFYFHNKHRAKEIYRLGVNEAKNHDGEDVISSLQNVAHQMSVEDVDWARDIFEMALKKAELATSSFPLRNIARTLCEKDGLDDLRWGKQVFLLAIDKEQSSDDFSQHRLDMIYDMIEEVDNDWAIEIREGEKG